MKIAITGHTRGFGKYMYDTLYAAGHTVVGFSKTTGYDISMPKIREQIVSSVSDCDIFINNAHADFFQVEMLYELFSSWALEKKLIVNIGSNARDFTNRDRPYDYAVQKLALNHASKQLGRSNTCKVTTVDFGFLVRDSGSVIGYDAAFEYIQIALNSVNKSHRVLEILVAHD